MQPERDAEVYLSETHTLQTYRQHAARHIGTSTINRLPDRHIGILIAKEGTKDGAVHPLWCHQKGLSTDTRLSSKFEIVFSYVCVFTF